MRTLVTSILERGLLTNAMKEQGVEMLASRPIIDADDTAATAYAMTYGRKILLANACSILHTKGRKRTVAANIAIAVVQAASLESEFADAWRASFATIHCLLRPVKGLRESVDRARYITVQSTETRRPVNCFNHIHHLRLIQTYGSQEWTT